MKGNEITDQNQLYLALGYCVFMLLLGLIVQKFPPKRINHLYGYRTNRSMKNQTIWDAANRYASKVFVRISLYSFLLPIGAYFMFPKYNILVTIIGNTVLLLLVIYATEKYLSSHFDSGGNPHA